MLMPKRLVRSKHYQSATVDLFSDESTNVSPQKYKSLLDGEGERIVIEKKEESLIAGVFDDLDVNSLLGEEKEPEVIVRKANCGRIQFENVIVPPSAPRDLVCEECEKAFSVLFCGACKQVFCAKCADLCHRIEIRGMELHPHEEEGFIRPLVYGDKSSIKITKEFVMPSMDLFEEDYLRIKDLSQPQSLAVNKTYDLEKSNEVFTGAKYTVNEILLFIDPVTNEEAYGRVISEWDFRHGEVAPSITRGDKSAIFYVVEMQGLVSDLGSLSELIKKLVAKPPPPEYPKLEGLADIPNRYDFYVATEFNKRRETTLHLQKYGPTRHFLKDDGEHYDDSSIGAAINSSSGVAPGAGARGDGVGAGGRGGSGSGPSAENSSLLHSPTSRPGEDEGSAKVPVEGVNISPSSSSSTSTSTSTPVVMIGSILIAQAPVVFPDPYAKPKYCLPPHNRAARQRRNIEAANRSPRPMEQEKRRERQLQRRQAQLASLAAEAGRASNNQDKALSIENQQLNGAAARKRQKEEEEELPWMQGFDPEIDTVYDIVAKAQSLSYEDKVPKAAMERRPFHAVGLHGPSDGVLKRLRIVGEIDLTRPTERQNLLNNKKFDFLRSFLNKRFFSMFALWQKMYFEVWKDNMEHLRAVKMEYCAQRIQALVRMWLCRDLLETKRLQLEQDIRRKWEAVHSRFHMCTRDTPGSCTVDNILYFRTILDVNRYCAFLRKMVMRVAKTVDRKRLRQLQMFVRRWKDAVDTFTIADLKRGHFQPWAVDHEEEGESIGVEEQQRRALLAHTELVEDGVTFPLPSQDEESDSIHEDHFAVREHVLAMPMGLKREMYPPTLPASKTPLGEAKVYLPSVAPKYSESASMSSPSQSTASLVSKKSLASSVRTDNTVYAESEAIELPPWHPSLGMKLPKLQPMYYPTTAEERLTITRHKRLNHFSFKAHAEGPTDASVWVVPNFIMMGAKPWGAARPRSSMTAIHALMLSSVVTFVSLMEEEEEEAMEQRHGVEPMHLALRKAFNSVKFAITNIILQSTSIIEAAQDEVRSASLFKKGDVRFEEESRRRLKAMGRMKRAQDAIKRAKDQMARIPSKYDFIRIPLQNNTAPSIHEILPPLWELEKRLARQEVLYVYSKEGHGRVGLVSGCLLGRLYGLTAEETLYRIQTCHDCMRVEESRPMPVGCPQLPIQRNLITEVLEHTNKAHTGTTFRTVMDPESTIEEQHHLIRGCNTGVDWTKSRRHDPERREMMSIQWDRDLVRDTPAVVPTAEHGRADNDQLDLQAMYDEAVIGQSKDIVRALPLKRRDPTPTPNSMYLLRHVDAEAASPSKPK